MMMIRKLILQFLLHRLGLTQGWRFIIGICPFRRKMNFWKHNRQRHLARVSRTDGLRSRMMTRVIQSCVLSVSSQRWGIKQVKALSPVVNAASLKNLTLSTWPKRAAILQLKTVVTNKLAELETLLGLISSIASWQSLEVISIRERLRWMHLLPGLVVNPISTQWRKRKTGIVSTLTRCRGTSNWRKTQSIWLWIR